MDINNDLPFVKVHSEFTIPFRHIEAASVISYKRKDMPFINGVWIISELSENVDEIAIVSTNRYIAWHQKLKIKFARDKLFIPRHVLKLLRKTKVVKNQDVVIKVDEDHKKARIECELKNSQLIQFTWHIIEDQKLPDLDRVFEYVRHRNLVDTSRTDLSFNADNLGLVSKAIKKLKLPKSELQRTRWVIPHEVDVPVSFIHGEVYIVVMPLRV